MNDRTPDLGSRIFHIMIHDHVSNLTYHRGVAQYFCFNLFTTIHDGNFRRHLSMNVTIK